MADKKEYEEVEGIKCKVKNANRKGVVKFYQESLRPEIDKYIGSITVWTDSKKNYRDALEINLKVAPFVLGWLHKPEDEDEYRVIKGYMSLEELEASRAKEMRKKPVTTKKATSKETASKTTRKKI